MGCENSLRGGYRVDAHPFSISPLPFELDDPVDFGEESIVASLPHIEAGVNPRPALPDQNASWFYQLSCKAFHAQSLSVAVPAVS